MTAKAPDPALTALMIEQPRDNHYLRWAKAGGRVWCCCKGVCCSQRPMALSSLFMFGFGMSVTIIGVYVVPYFQGTTEWGPGSAISATIGLPMSIFGAVNYYFNSPTTRKVTACLWLFRPPKSPERQSEPLNLPPL